MNNNHGVTLDDFDHTANQVRADLINGKQKYI